MKHSEGYVGMQVYFGRSNGEQTLGKIVKINPKKFKVEQLESRGTRKSHNVGTVWTVPPSLCTPATDVPGGDYATKSDSDVTVIDVTSMVGDMLAKKVKEWDDADGSWTTAEVREAVEIVLGDGGFRAIEVIETLRALREPIQTSMFNRTSDETKGTVDDDESIIDIAKEIGFRGLTPKKGEEYTGKLGDWV